MTDRELLEYIAAQVGTLTQDVSELKEGQNDLKEGQKKLENVTLKMEQTYGPKIEALFDGYMQSIEKLEQIQKEISGPQEVILRRTK